MSRRGGLAGELLLVLLLVAAAGAGVTAAYVALRRAAANPEAPATAGAARVPIGAESPIAAEAGVYRTGTRMLSVGDPETPRRPANPRTLHLYQVRRAFPGAPPRIPHGLTNVEFRTSACNTCHERGGYSPRFGAYVPVTPHPEQSACLQCHVVEDQVSGVDLPGHDPNTICSQCHDPDAPRRLAPERGAARWPRLAASSDGSPPVVPHQFWGRENCVACHAGPGAVQEIRTGHPERSGCRQCHVPLEIQTGLYTRAPPSDSAARGQQ